MIRFGLVGAGAAALTHAREIAKLDGAAVAAVHARNSENGVRFAREQNIPRHFSDLDDMLAQPDIDAVIVATPNGAHLEPARSAARAGKHVVVEKPLEISVDRAEAIIDACRVAGVGLFTIYQRRHARVVEAARAAQAAGALGTPVLVNVVDNQYRPPAYYADAPWRGTRALEGGGCLSTQSVHMLDLMLHLCGSVQSVAARTARRFHAIETEDTAVVTLEFTSGALGTLSSSTAAYPGQRHLMTLSGTEGSLIFNAEYDQLVFCETLTGDLPPVLAHMGSLPRNFSFRDPMTPADYPTHGQGRQLSSITALLSEGSVPAMDDARTAELLAPNRLLEAIYASAAVGGAPIAVMV